MSKDNNKRIPGLGLSLSVFLGILSILVIGITIFKMDIISLLVICLIMVFGVSMTLGYSIDELFESMGDSLKKASVSMMFFFIIGMLIGAWIISGTVPALIYYGIKFITPKFFLPAGFIVCCITSYATGTSWGTAGTIGLALMGMGIGMGIPAPVVAGMVVAGSAFGDHFSPMSDTTILASASAEVELYDHVKSMSKTIIPAALITIGVFTFLGFKYSNGEVTSSIEIEEMQNVLSGSFNLSLLTFLPLIIVLGLSLMKFPSIPTLLLGILSAGIIAVLTQGASITEVIGALNNGYTQATGNALVDELVLRGGIQSMMWTFSLAFIALLLGGLLERVGYLKVLIAKVASKLKSKGALVATTYITGLLGNMAMGEVYLSIILNGSLYKDLYDEKEVERTILSRMLEEGATLGGPLIPWTTCAAFMAGTLGVSTFEYLPYTVLNYVAPALSIIIAFMGVKTIAIKKSSKANL